VDKQKLDKETDAEPWPPSEKQCEINACRDHISHKIDVSKQLDADFNFLTIHLMSHWVEQIRPYRALQPYSAESHEQAHKMNLKDVWNASDQNLNYLPQVITFQRRNLCFDIREVNVQALAQRRENSAAPCQVIPSGVHVAAPMSCQL